MITDIALPGPDTPVIDESRLMAEFGGDLEILAELRDLFLDHAPPLHEAIKQAIIAEDLGIITPEVTEIMDRFGFPGMKLLIFAFGNDLPTNPYAPHNVVQNCIVYTGTHDNNTIRGWFENEAPPEVKERIFRYMGREVPAEEISMTFVRLAMMTVAHTVIFPVQDLLGLGEEARMNRPATRDGNWEWRLDVKLLDKEASRILREMTELYGRG